MNKLLIAITGASGSIYAKCILKKISEIKNNGHLEEVALVISKNAKQVWDTELEEDLNYDSSFKIFDSNDFNAPFASGSGNYNTMIIIPCSMGTVGRIAAGISNDLVSRAADVILKERRKLICVVRETPYSLIHLKNMEQITLAGGIICPATPSFYSKPKSIEDVANTVVDRVLDLAGFPVQTFRWGN
ncbi:MAG: UbiX family flavin prenyltransferase [Ferruginibacter sp.]